MNNKFNRYLLAFCALAMLTACGSDNDKSSGNASAYQSGTDYCSEAFLKDYNGLEPALTNSKSIDEARAIIDHFDNKYRSVKCKAKNEQTGQIMYIDVNAGISALRKILATVPPSPRSSSPTRSDACTQAFIADHNNLVKTVQDTNVFEVANNAINAYERKYKGLRCVATDLSNNRETWISADETVARGRKAIEPYRPVKPQVMTPVNPAPTNPAPVAVGNPRASAIDANIVDLKAVTFEVVNADSMNQLRTSASDRYVSSGVVMPIGRNRAVDAKVFCTVDADNAVVFKAGDVVRFEQSEINVKGASVVLEKKGTRSSSELKVTCIRMDYDTRAPKPWTISEIQGIFGQIANVNPVR